MDTSRIPIGSKLLGIENPKDQDFCYIAEDKDKIPDAIYENKTYGIDIRIVEKNDLLNRLEFKKFDFYIVYNYQYDKNINPIFAQFYKYNILEHSELLKSFLKKIVSKH